MNITTSNRPRFKQLVRVGDTVSFFGRGSDTAIRTGTVLEVTARDPGGMLRVKAGDNEHVIALAQVTAWTVCAS